mmetsp:Transcript_9111/g.22308  ORF Transcript_9111/g.22308 Transcript_9111/m.22308 type:complete len:104 (-) Transcript_9111:369-680(-)
MEEVHHPAGRGDRVARRGVQPASFRIALLETIDRGMTPASGDANKTGSSFSATSALFGWLCIWIWIWIWLKVILRALSTTEQSPTNRTSPSIGMDKVHCGGFD